MSCKPHSKCNAKCWNAKNVTCTCVCGGVNHGSGKAQANWDRVPIEECEQCQELFSVYALYKSAITNRLLCGACSIREEGAVREGS